MESIYISIVGIAYLLMLFIPNGIWTRYQPIGYDSSHENKVLCILERTGQVLVTFFSVVVFKEPQYNFDMILISSIIIMILYECYWIRYFKSEKTLFNFYRPFLRIPVPGATLPVIAFLLLGVYQMNIPLIISILILGIGHIGIHLEHLNEINL